jgi:hypothetical protein
MGTAAAPSSLCSRARAARSTADEATDAAPSVVEVVEVSSCRPTRCQRTTSLSGECSCGALWGSGDGGGQQTGAASIRSVSIRIDATRPRSDSHSSVRGRKLINKERLEIQTIECSTAYPALEDSRMRPTPPHSALNTLARVCTRRRGRAGRRALHGRGGLHSRRSRVAPRSG